MGTIGIGAGDVVEDIVGAGVAGTGGVVIGGAGDGPGAGAGLVKPLPEIGLIVPDEGIEGEGPAATIAGLGVKLGSGREPSMTRGGGAFPYAGTG